MKVLKHFKLVTTHKWYVFKNCCRAGIPVQGFLHDMSKYSPIEFFESVKYFTGERSPIDNCKADHGYSMAWFHHRGRNKHHYEFWMDNFDKGGFPVEMPYKYAVELICDYLGAAQAYLKQDFTYKNEYDWWLKKKSNNIAMHPNTIKFVDSVLYALSTEGKSIFHKNQLMKFYKLSRGESY